MSPIICVTEFDELTVTAMQTAAALAQRAGEPIFLVRSVDEREQFPYALRNRLIESDRPRLAAEAQRLRQQGFDFEEVVLRGMPEDGIAGFAWRTRARLIVAGCKPTATVEHWALGCVAEEISDTSLVPVLAVRSSAPVERWLAGSESLNVLVAFDPAARPDAVLNRLDELQRLGVCRIKAAIVPHPENKAEPAHDGFGPEGVRFSPGGRHDLSLARELAARNVTVEDVGPVRDVAAGLVARALDSGVDLLVVSTHPRDDLTLLPHPVLAHGVLRRAPMNVLCVPEPDIEPPHAATGSDASQEPLTAGRPGTVFSGGNRTGA